MGSAYRLLLTGGVPSPWSNLAITLLLSVTVSSGSAAMTTANGDLAPDRALDQTRMLPPTSGAQGTASVTPDGMELPKADEEAEDGTFGKQVVLTRQEKKREFIVTSDVSLFGTSNAALTEHGADADVFIVASAAFGWSHAINSELQFQVAGHAAIFRYDKRSDLDFDSFGGGLGVEWTPNFASGISFFGRYDATKLLKRGGGDLLTEHAFTAGAMKTMLLSRAQALSFQFVGGLGITDPHSAQRDLLGVGIGYHLRLSRMIDLDTAYRASGYFYDTHGRIDFNGVASLSLGYHLTPWSTVSVYESFGDNRSNRAGFDYDAWFGGGGIGLAWQF
jgi:hypothetical protein